MKTRSGFVSNSSTSSFVVVYNPKNFVVCEHCRRGHEDPVEMVRSSAHLRPGHTELECADPQDKLAEWQLEVEDLRAKMKKLGRNPANETVWEDGRSIGQTWKVIHNYDYRARLMEGKIKKLKAILENGDMVVWASIHYDDPVGKELKALEEKGLVRWGKEIY